MTKVAGVLRLRGLTLDTFADLTDAALVGIESDGLTFNADLDAATVQAIRDRMTSTDDADRAARANLACLRDAITGTDPTSLALVAAINYMLGV